MVREKRWWASLVPLVVKNPPPNAGDARDTGSIPGSGRPPGLEKKWQPTPVFLPGIFHGQRSLAGCSSWGRQESDMTEHTGGRGGERSWLRVLFFFNIFIYLLHLIYLAVPGLSLGTWDLWLWPRHTGSLVEVYRLLVARSNSLARDWTQAPCVGLPGKSPWLGFLKSPFGCCVETSLEAQGGKRDCCPGEGQEDLGHRGRERKEEERSGYWAWARHHSEIRGRQRNTAMDIGQERLVGRKSAQRGRAPSQVK